MKTTLGQMGPASTPNIIRTIITAICSVTLVAAFLDPILIGYLGFSLQKFLSLSSRTLNLMFLWQPVSYLFLLQSAGSLTFGLIIALFFQMFILWMMGSNVAERFGTSSFLKLYFGAGICAALLALPLYMSSPFLMPYAGPTASLFALFLVWAYMHQESQILLFFIFPIKAKWLLAGGAGAAFLVFLANGSLISLTMLLTGILFGYLYAVFFKGMRSPYEFLESVDNFFQKKRSIKSPKIFDLKTGKPVETDEEFLDRVLEKISRHGEMSLTKEEKARLEKISRKKL